MPLDALVGACRAALQAADPRGAVADVIARAVADADQLEATCAPGRLPDARGVSVLYSSPQLTLVHVALAPGFTTEPHDHGMWAAIGVAQGQERNLLYRTRGSTVVLDREVTVHTGQVLRLDADVVHAIANPSEIELRGLHAYGGDLRGRTHRRWDPETLTRCV